jgi:hypothetical protein
MEGFTGGEHEIITMASAPTGETTGKVTTRFVYPDKPPVWVGSREGISDQGFFKVGHRWQVFARTNECD